MSIIEQVPLRRPLFNKEEELSPKPQIVRLILCDVVMFSLFLYPSPTLYPLHHRPERILSNALTTFNMT